MGRLLLTLVLVLCMACAALAGSMSIVRTDGNGTIVSERVLNLPDDGGKFFVSLILHDDWRSRPAEVQLVTWWKTDMAVRQYREQARFNLYTESDPWFRQALSRAVPSIPTVLIQEPSGKVLFPLKGDTLPTTAPAFAGIFSRLRNHCPGNQPDQCPDGKCPLNKPEQDAQPEEKPDAEPQTQLPDVNPPQQPEQVQPDIPAFPWAALAVALVLTGIVVSVVVSVRQFKQRVAV